jgi:hypothetical protein
LEKGELQELEDVFGAAWAKIRDGDDVTLRVVRGGVELQLQGRAGERLEGTFYVQEKIIWPASLDNQTLYFNMREPTGQPVRLRGR